MSLTLQYRYVCQYGDCGLQPVAKIENLKGVEVGHLECGHRHIIGCNITPLDGTYVLKNGEWHHCTTKADENLGDFVEFMKR